MSLCMQIGVCPTECPNESAGIKPKVTFHMPEFLRHSESFSMGHQELYLETSKGFFCTPSLSPPFSILFRRSILKTIMRLLVLQLWFSISEFAVKSISQLLLNA